MTEVGGQKSSIKERTILPFVLVRFFVFSFSFSYPFMKGGKLKEYLLMTSAVPLCIEIFQMLLKL